jgi:2-polyprenyl-6-hydroxyphenyl methylase/3-demethylubiquinone-9 3-methyltransferase
MDYLQTLGNEWDIVYSWGVLHHTGAQWRALANVVPLVRCGGKLFLALYNDQGWLSLYWTAVKRFYNAWILGRIMMILLHLPYLMGARYVVRVLNGRLMAERGMTLWYDMLDWLGGYPFEVATPEQVFYFLRDQDFSLDQLKTCRGRHGCNEFVFVRK